jgi:uncharacterized membrane protein YfcA
MLISYLIVCLAALLGSALTLFSGFGLGTILVPVFGLFFPIELAIALTAIVHFLNNIFKFFLFGKKADKTVLLYFGIPSVVASLLGALLLTAISSMQPFFQYELLGKSISVMPVKLIIAIILLFFALFEILPALSKLQFDKKYLPLGGVLSGFFGGLSGNQGALRSAFLIRTNLTKEALVATGVVLSCLVDATRLMVYSSDIFKMGAKLDTALLICATCSAFIGAYFGGKLLQKVTLKKVQMIVAIMLIIFSLLLSAGII